MPQKSSHGSLKFLLKYECQRRRVKIKWRHHYEATDPKWRWDVRGLSGSTLSPRADRDERYAHDDLRRLTQADRGQVSGHAGSPSLSPGGTRGQRWSLDALGNWASMVRDLTGNGVFTDGGDLEEIRTAGGRGRTRGATGRGSERPVLSA